MDDGVGWWVILYVIRDIINFLYITGFFMADLCKIILGIFYTKIRVTLLIYDAVMLKEF